VNTLTALAEDPERFTEPPDGSERVVTQRSCLIIGPERRWAGVCALRLPDDLDAVATEVESVRRIGTLEHHLQAQYGSSAPILRTLGFVEVATVHSLQS
jgi:hypothetical protein